MTEDERRAARANWPVRIYRIGEEPSDFAYWQSRPPMERLDALADVREDYHGMRSGFGSDLKVFIEELNRSAAKYLIVGGFAVAFHGHPRYTKDMDVWIEQTDENTSRVIAAINAFGFGSLGLTPADLMEPNVVVQLGQPPNRIDILTRLEGVDFATAYEGRVVLEADWGSTPFIGLESLKTNKRALGRHQDLADLEALE